MLEQAGCGAPRGSGLASLEYGLAGIATVFELGPPTPLLAFGRFRSGTLPAVHPASPVRHRGRPTRTSASPTVCSAAWRGVHCKRSNGHLLWPPPFDLRRPVPPT